MTLKECLEDLVNALQGTDAAHEVDAGCEGNGPLARAMVKLGRFKSTDEATDAIYGDDLV